MRLRHLLAAAVLWRTTSARAQVAPSTNSIRRIAPAAFPSLPAAVRRDLETRRCLIPQPFGDHAARNVIQGAFTAAAATQWVVLCSVRDTSRILIYHIGTGHSARIVDSLLPAADVAWMQGVGAGRWGYSRLLQTMPLTKIRMWRSDVDARAIPQPIDHDAIEQLIVGKAAEAMYYAAGRWYRKVTAD
jgi:hypothetical protein